jgi:hypothetical protein
MRRRAEIRRRSLKGVGRRRTTERAVAVNAFLISSLHLETLEPATAFATVLKRLPIAEAEAERVF